MSEITNDIEYLSQEIGPRPAGTEEEQQAALYLADQMQKRAGFAANIEDFTAAVHPGIVEAICFGIPALCSLLAIVFNVLSLPTFLIALACAILYAFELMDRPLLSRAFERGVSQNVVARYRPGKQASQRNRKVILVANYDSSKVQAELNGALFGIYPNLVKASTISLVALPVIWLLRVLFPIGASGVALGVFNIITAVALVLALVPVALFFMHKAATYNEAANNNAAGVATLLEVARLIAEGSVSEEELEARVDMRQHSVEEAYAAGVVPEGAELEYVGEEPASEEERLASAKAAVAAITGQPVREYHVEKIDFTPLAERDDIDVYEEMDYGEYAYPEEDEGAVGQGAAAGAPGQGELPEEGEAVPADQSEAATEVLPPLQLDREAARPQAGYYETPFAEKQAGEPSWFTSGRAKAAKPEDGVEAPVKRSQYADAFKLAVSESQAHMDEAARLLDEGTIERISQMRRDFGASAGLEAAKPSADAPLQDILSPEPDAQHDETATQAAERPAPKAPARADNAGQEALPVSSDDEESLEAIGDGRAGASAEGGQSENERSEEAVRVREDLAGSQGGPAVVAAAEEQRARSENQDGADQPSLDGKTTAMAPINVDFLREDSAKKEQEKDADAAAAAEVPSYDFSKIESAPLRRYRSIALPSFDGATTSPNDGPARHNNDLESGRIPRISVEAESVPVALVQEDTPSAPAAPAAPRTAERIVDARRAELRNVIPSLSGEFSPVEIATPADEENTEVSRAGSFATGGIDASFSPVGDELVADLPTDERYVEDADDSAYDENATETGAYTGPGYVDMPDSRIGRFFSRFRKKEAEETSASEWLDVDEDFNPTEVGAARGGWESFRNDAGGDVQDVDERRSRKAAAASDDEDEYAEDFDSDERTWHGGAFSQARAKLSGIVNAGGEAPEADEADVSEDAKSEEGATGASEDAAGSGENGSAAEAGAAVADALGPDGMSAEEAKQVSDEVQAVYGLRNPDINTEVWFVALGAEYAGNGGMKAFLAEHASDMRGAIVVNLEAMGAGALSFIDEEGCVLTSRPSSRLKRYLRKATEATGVGVASASIAWRESAASLAMKRGIQAMSLVGMEGKKPALLGQGDDVLENVDEELVEENARFVLELIKNI